MESRRINENQKVLRLVVTHEVNPSIGRLNTNQRPGTHVTIPNPLHYNTAIKANKEPVKPRPIKITARQRHLSIGNVAAAAHSAALYNRVSRKRKVDDIEAKEMDDNESDKHQICIRSISKSPVSAFYFSSFLGSPPAHKHNVDDFEEISDEDDSDGEVDIDLLTPFPPTTLTLPKRQRVNDDLLPSNFTPCYELRCEWWISRQPNHITRYIIKDDKRTQEGWRRRGVECYPNLVSTCRKKTGLEWMLD